MVKSVVSVPSCVSWDLATRNLGYKNVFNYAAGVSNSTPVAKQLGDIFGGVSVTKAGGRGVTIVTAKGSKVARNVTQAAKALEDVPASLRGPALKKFSAMHKSLRTRNANLPIKTGARKEAQKL